LFSSFPIQFPVPCLRPLYGAAHLSEAPVHFASLKCRRRTIAEVSLPFCNFFLPFSRLPPQLRCGTAALSGARTSSRGGCTSFQDPSAFYPCPFTSSHHRVGEARLALTKFTVSLVGAVTDSMKKREVLSLFFLLGERLPPSCEEISTQPCFLFKNRLPLFSFPSRLSFSLFIKDPDWVAELTSRLFREMGGLLQIA